MEELIAEIKSFLGERIQEAAVKGPAGINLVPAENEDPVTFAADLKAPSYLLLMNLRW